MFGGFSSCCAGNSRLSHMRRFGSYSYRGLRSQMFGIESTPIFHFNPKLCGPTLAEEHDREIWTKSCSPRWAAEGNDVADPR
jgi:hypothetical protein